MERTTREWMRKSCAQWSTTTTQRRHNTKKTFTDTRLCVEIYVTNTRSHTIIERKEEKKMPIKWCSAKCTHINRMILSSASLQTDRQMDLYAPLPIFRFKINSPTSPTWGFCTKLSIRRRKLYTKRMRTHGKFDSQQKIYIFRINFGWFMWLRAFSTVCWFFTKLNDRSVDDVHTNSTIAMSSGQLINRMQRFNKSKTIIFTFETLVGWQNGSSVGRTLFDFPIIVKASSHQMLSTN